MVPILGINVLILRCVYLLRINMMHLSGCLGLCRMHNIVLLHLDVFLGNRAVGGDFFLRCRFRLFTSQCL